MKKIFAILKELVTSFIIALILFGLISAFFRIGKVDGISMESTYYDGDTVLIKRRDTTYERGDIVTFIYNESNENYYIESTETVYQKAIPNPDMIGEQHIKRVVGIPGDHIVITDSKLYVNDEFVSESNTYIVDQDYYLAEDEYFVQGDNLDHSFDSRHHGPIKADQIYGSIFVMEKVFE